MDTERRSDLKILVVDDDRPVADTLAEYLTGVGYRTRAAYSGREALDLFKAGSFQMLLTDLKMPDMDGLALIDAVKSIKRLAPVIVMTGYGTIDAAVDAIKRGAYDFLSKPFQYDDLVGVIDRALDQYLLAERVRVLRRRAIFLICSLPIWFWIGYWISQY